MKTATGFWLWLLRYVGHAAVTLPWKTIYCLPGRENDAALLKHEIRATNNITSYYSDGRLKDILGPIKNALSKVGNLNGVIYKNNDIAATHGYTTQEEQVGVIAQDVQRVLPQVVVPAPFDIGKREDGTEYSLSGEDYMTVRYEKLVPLLIEAIKELTMKVNRLETLVD